MALEAVVFPKDPFTYSSCKEFSFLSNSELDRWNFEFEFALQENSMWSVLPPSSELVAADGDTFNEQNPAAAAAIGGGISKKKRRRLKRCKNKEEAESQRMTHIAVERNRRRQMNDYLSVLRSIMPASYVHKSDQASIIGGAISYVKELEYLLQTLEAQKKISHPLTFLSSDQDRNTNKMEEMEAMDAAADIEVTMVESHANLKVLSKKQPRQLMKMVIGLQNLSLTTLHLNLTTINEMVLYSFSLKVTFLSSQCYDFHVNEEKFVSFGVLIHLFDSYCRLKFE
ncbi:transcription factor bHLH94-like [Dendrobium catenatum]|uniref:transcription factor bHLH94-like n=1 Tax=Dendrobium catenatum TaxID=906689 RepID=UPI0009F66486|nr:transcription factor bHLH94-like [Dendrobium catenatum]